MKEPVQKVINALSDIQAEGNFSARKTTEFTDLTITIKEVGELKFPLKPAKARALIKRAKPAKYGYRDQTILDPEVRNVWEIPKSLVKIDKRKWNKTLNPVLLELEKVLGLTELQHFKAQLHNFLIYEKGQFFQSHQDTEKQENMVATLVVLLPSRYRGGTLSIENQSDVKHYPSTSTPENKLTFIAFYADCHHQVKIVTEGYRVAMTYNLILENSGDDTAEPVIEKQSQRSLDKAIAHYFSQTEPSDSYYSRQCNKLVYLLDHQYSPKGIKWGNLKSKDKIRVQALCETAKQNDLEIFLTLADIQETWDCQVESDYRSQYGDWGYDDEDDLDSMDEDSSLVEDSIELHDLIADETIIRHWTDIMGKQIKYPELSVRGQYVGWTKANNDCKPFESEYEGYMGNWGNTMEYWYHRAAIVLWLKQDHYNVLLEFNPARVIEELLTMAQDKSKKEQVTEIVNHLLNDWTGLDNSAKSADYNRVLKLACLINNAVDADLLLAKLDRKAFTPSSMSYIIQLEKIYGTAWCIKLLEQWYAGKGRAGMGLRTSVYAGSSSTIEALDKIISKLVSATKNSHKKLINWLLNYQWQTLQDANESQLKSYQNAQLEEQAEPRFKQIKELLQSCVLSQSQLIHDEIIQYMMAHQSLYSSVRLVHLLINFKGEYQSEPFSCWMYKDLSQTLSDRLKTDQKKGGRKPGDWSIMDRNICTCHDCLDLNNFLQSSDLQQKIWPINKDRRFHIHQIITKMRICVTHQTKRTGSPHKLVLVKTKELFSQDKVRIKEVDKALKTLLKSGLV